MKTKLIFIFIFLFITPLYAQEIPTITDAPWGSSVKNCIALGIISPTPSRCDKKNNECGYPDPKERKIMDTVCLKNGLYVFSNDKLFLVLYDICDKDSAYQITSSMIYMFGKPTPLERHYSGDIRIESRVLRWVFNEDAFAEILYYPSDGTYKTSFSNFKYCDQAMNEKERIKKEEEEGNKIPIDYKP